MGRHNGGTRSKGGNLAVGAALTNKQKGKIRPGAPKGSTEPTSHRHTTEAPASGLQSMLDATDLSELMDMASLANRDFSAEKACDAVIIGPTLVENGGTGAGGPTLSPEERDAAEAAAAEALKLPRRPQWSPEMSAAELDARERASFVSWRRGLAALEASGTVPLTPFEKNLDVWRQLWRVIERSHVLVQVVDARDPLRYLSADLALAAAEAAGADPAPPLLVLLNKADLLPQEVREAWAGELEARGLSFAWWSAKAAGDAAAEQASAVVAALSAGLPPPDFPVPEPTAESDRTRIRGAEELLEWLEREARAAAKGATGRRSVAASFLGESDSDSDDGEEGREGRAGKEEVGESEGGGEGGGDDGLTEEQRHRRETANRRPTAGFVGFPNVGKSSTLNALFGRKKAAVAPTPGKTKHFQTLDLFVRGGRTLTLCDCPGLVFPRVASSKADMVAAGVVPIDRLTDVRAPVAVVCAEVGREGLERAYGVRLPPLRPGETRRSPPFAADVLRAVALSRGWVVQNALPDESRAGRMILRDHCSGKLPHFCWPPGKEPKKEGEAAAAAAAAGEVEASASAEAAEAARDDSSAPLTPDARSPPASASAAEQREFLISEEARAEAQRELDALELNGEDDETDLEALEAEAAFVAGASAQQQQRAKRAAHKFQKRPARTKGDRGQGRQGLENGYDGAAMATGKKGGLVRGGVMTPAL